MYWVVQPWQSREVSGNIITIGSANDEKMLIILTPNIKSSKQINTDGKKDKNKCGAFSHYFFCECDACGKTYIR